MSDSTNAEKGGFTFCEKEVRRAFEDIFAKTTGWIIIATFASNIHRIQQAIDVACQFGRRVAMCGKSMVANAQIALDLGYLKVPEDTWVRLDCLRETPDPEVVIITTGSQGEPMSVLSRIAIDEHKHIKIREGDTVILSARVIPGNERPIGRIINHLMKRGANVIYEKVSDIHVSGHASKEELKLMMNLVRPKYFMPIHGEFRHLRYHARLAERSGIPRERIFMLENGMVLEITTHDASLSAKVPSGRIYIDGKAAAGVEDIVLRDRKRLAHDGIVVVLVGIEKDTKKVISGPEVISRGFVFEDASQEVINDVRDLMSHTLSSLDDDIISDVSLVQAKLRSTLKKYLRNTMDRKPLIMPIIMEV
jgi:ribonuclease J